VGSWNFLTNHGRALLCIAQDPEMRLQDIAVFLNITERRAHGIVTDLTEAGYVVKIKDGRRNRYRIQAHLPLREPTGRQQAIGEVLQLLSDTDAIPRGLPTRRGDMITDGTSA
jgi:hypothetical protein